MIKTIRTHRDFRGTVLHAACVLTAVVLAACSGHSAGTANRAGEPTDLAATKLADALDRSGMNRSEIETFLIGQVGERKIAAEFIVANMPTVDLVSMRASDLEENLEYAFRARGGEGSCRGPRMFRLNCSCTTSCRIA
jgi:hypothetical protein